MQRWKSSIAPLKEIIGEQKLTISTKVETNKVIKESEHLHNHRQLRFCIAFLSATSERDSVNGLLGQETFSVMAWLFTQARNFFSGIGFEITECPGPSFAFDWLSFAAKTNLHYFPIPDVTEVLRKLENYHCAVSGRPSATTSNI